MKNQRSSGTNPLMPGIEVSHDCGAPLAGKFESSGGGVSVHAVQKKAPAATNANANRFRFFTFVEKS
ncbi:MAG: hypothetical protein LUD52_05790 [Opitutae bacterium]|nr:hypothetical protein [Opitutae bacterium]